MDNYYQEFDKVQDVEKREIWRRRIRDLLGCFDLREVDAAPEVVGWIKNAFALADEIEDEHSAAQAAASIAGRARALMQSHRQLAGKSSMPKGLDYPEVVNLSDTLTSLAGLQGNYRKVFGEGRAGLALSGGGIRSASFNLGILESLDKSGVLPHIDYLSTVSGGGYIGAAMTFHSAREQRRSPFRPDKGGGSDHRIDWMRAHGAYLSSGREVNALTLTAAVVRSIGLNLLFVVPLFFGLMYLLTLGCDANATCTWPVDKQKLTSPLGVGLMLAAAAGLFAFVQRLALERSIPAVFRVPGRWSLGLWAVAFTVLYLLRDSTHFELGAWVLLLAPPLLIGLRSLLAAGLKDPWEWIEGRMSMVVPETFAWLTVAGLIYLLLQAMPLNAAYPFGHLILGLLGAVLLGKFIVNSLFMAIMSGQKARFDPNEQRTFAVQYGDLFGIGLFLLTIGLLPWVDQAVRLIWTEHSEKFLSGLTVTGVISTAAGWMRRGAGNERHGHVAFLLRFGVTVLIFAALVWMYRLALGVHSGEAIGPIVFISGVAIWIITAIVADLNYMSMHRYYRNRLADAFLVAPADQDVLFQAARNRVRIAPETAVFLGMHPGADRDRLLAPRTGKWLKLKKPRALSLERVLKVYDYGALAKVKKEASSAGFSNAREGSWRLRHPLTWSFWRAVKPAKNANREISSHAVAYLAACTSLSESRRQKIFEQLGPDGKMVTVNDVQTAVNTLGYRGTGAELSANIRLCDVNVGRSGAPYPIINTNLLIPGARTEKYRSRFGDSFAYTPRYTGSVATGWACEKGQDLGTAMAISGAALDPNTGVTLSMPLRIVMTLLNLRLGYWTVRPAKNRPDKLPILTWVRNENWPILVVREMFGTMNEETKYVRLSDGGHFENLGLYELIRRRCDTIIVCDAAADPGFRFDDLARAIERVRVDFGAEIEIDTTKLHPRGKTRQALSPFVRGKISYAMKAGEAAKTGDLIFIKTTLFAGLSEDILGYARAHEAFPDETTADQFFNEPQFEAYRQLGYRAGMQTFSSPGVASFVASVR